MPRFVPVFVAFVPALVACCLAAVAADSAPRRPNVLFLFSDDQRPDTIHALGNAIIETPHLDSLVAAGTTFTRAVSPDPICFQSRGEIISGACGFHNGMMGPTQKLKPELTLWAQAMQQGGYETWYVGKWHTSRWPADRGYEETSGLFTAGGSRWAKPQTDWKGFAATGYRGWIFRANDLRMLPEQGVGLTTRTSRQIADTTIDLLQRQRKDKPFFLHVNFTAPHDPLLMPPELVGKYDPKTIPLPANFLPQHPFDHGNLHGRDEELFSWPRKPDEVRGELACYYAVITQMDAEIGRILAALDASGQADNTVVIFSSDQGLALGSHGLHGKQNMYDHTVGVPLLMRGPGIPRNHKIAAQTYLRDLYPTALDMAGLPIPATVEARSLVPLLTGQASSLYSDVFCYFLDVQRMVRTDRWKLIYYPKIDRSQLFDLLNDPAELHDLVSDPAQASVLADLRARLLANQRAHGDPLAIDSSAGAPGR